ncbi:DUF892 family protein [Sulfitobacter sp. BDSS02]|nr:DUF892 family protein [Sulfitobacter sp. BDSS02]
MYISSFGKVMDFDPKERDDVTVLYNQALYDAYMIEMQGVQFLEDLAARASSPALQDLLYGSVDERRRNIDRLVDVISGIDVDPARADTQVSADTTRPLVMPRGFRSTRVNDIAVVMAAREFLIGQHVRLMAMKDLGTRPTTEECLATAIKEIEDLDSKLIKLQASV